MQTLLLGLAARWSLARRPAEDVCALYSLRASVAGTREANQPGRDTIKSTAARTSANISIGRWLVATPRNREAGHMLEVAVDHDLTIDAGYRSGQASGDEHQGGFDEQHEL